MSLIFKSSLFHNDIIKEQQKKTLEYHCKNLKSFQLTLLGWMDAVLKQSILLLVSDQADQTVYGQLTKAGSSN